MATLLFLVSSTTLPSRVSRLKDSQDILLCYISKVLTRPFQLHRTISTSSPWSAAPGVTRATHRMEKPSRKRQANRDSMGDAVLNERPILPPDAE
ncbi:uncharacterized protein TRIREDRAFT_112427, partial [Trichoderma reesei QM6a]